MRFIDFFAGIGGFRRGLELAGHKCVGFCEVDKYAVASYTSMHLITEEQRKYLETLPLRQRQKEILGNEKYKNGEWFSNDIKSLNGGDIPNVDCWCAGFPCTDISVAGKQLGLDSERSGLFFEIIRLLTEKDEAGRPEWIILENVKNLLSIHGGWDFARVLSGLDEVGYDAEWELFNSKHYGVPQNRERVYIVGHLRSKGDKRILPITGTDVEGNPARINILAHRDGYRRNTQTFDPDGVTEALSTCQGGGREHHVGIKVIASARPKKDNYGADRERVLATDSICPSLRATDYKEPIRVGAPVCIPVITPERVNKRQNGRRFKEDGDESFTLTAQDRHGVAIGVNMSGHECKVDGMEVAHCLNANDQRKVFGANQDRTMVGVLVEWNPEAHEGIYVDLGDGCVVYAVWYEKYQCYITIRKLTPKECFRLQGWSDDYYEKAEFVNSNSQLYKQAGNGVTVSVVRILGEAIK